MEALIEEGCVVVMTSNRAPWDLNRHGLHEDLFQHFVDRLLLHCEVCQLTADHDYRRLLAATPPVSPQALSFSLKTVCGTYRNLMYNS